MQSFRRRQHLARPLTAWLLLWFVLMAASAYRAPASHAPEAAGAHHAHAAQQADAHEGCDDDPAVAGEPPAHDAAHCPLCLHAAAPPLPWVGGPAAPPPAARLLATPHQPAPKVHTAAPPPARGPPALS